MTADPDKERSVINDNNLSSNTCSHFIHAQRMYSNAPAKAVHLPRATPRSIYVSTYPMAFGGLHADLLLEFGALRKLGQSEPKHSGGQLCRDAVVNVDVDREIEGSSEGARTTLA